MLTQTVNNLLHLSTFVVCSMQFAVSSVIDKPKVITDRFNEVM